MVIQEREIKRKLEKREETEVKKRNEVKNGGGRRLKELDENRKERREEMPGRRCFSENRCEPWAKYL